MQNNIRVKLAVFSILEGKLVIHGDNHLPVTDLKKRESLDSCVSELFDNATGNTLSDFYSEQLYTVDHPFSVVYFALIPHFQILNKVAVFKPINSHKFGHPDAEIVSYALQRLQCKIEYTNVVYSLLPDEFTLSELQTVYEAILNKKLDKRNFRKKMLSLGLLTSSGRKKKGVKARPAEIYTFKSRNPQIVKIFS